MDLAAPGAMRIFGGATFDAFLFDMDGTLLTSIAASQRVWGRWAAQYGLDAADFLPAAHGMRVTEVIARLAIPGVDPVVAADAILQGELADMAGIAQVAGAATFLSALPCHRWAVVTSAPRALACRRLAYVGLPIPPELIAAEDILCGKPDPACYELAAARLGFAPISCLVFEDASAGIAAGKAAGCTVLAITGANPTSVAIQTRSARDFTQLRVEVCDVSDKLAVYDFTDLGAR